MLCTTAKVVGAVVWVGDAWGLGERRGGGGWILVGAAVGGVTISKDDR